jgi:hypothetical protein
MRVLSEFRDLRESHWYEGEYEDGFQHSFRELIAFWSGGSRRAEVNSSCEFPVVHPCVGLFALRGKRAGFDR